MKPIPAKPPLFGIDVLLDHPAGEQMRAQLKNRRTALLAHPASVDSQLVPTWKRIIAARDIKLTTLLGPQHGFGGEKQDNMIESPHAYYEPLHIPIFSLYGDTRRLKPEWIDAFDVLLVDLQDVGTRVYTFLTTIGYLIEDIAKYPNKELWILDRPNPVGRTMDGLSLVEGHESFVGIAPIPMQHGLTLAEFALWYKAYKHLDTAVTVVPMLHWQPAYTPNMTAPWHPQHVWIPPSPNMPALYTTRIYPGTVMLEGTHISEGRGTTRPLSMIGHPHIDWQAVRSLLQKTPVMEKNRLRGGVLRDIVFQPTFHKQANVPCKGFDIITDDPVYNPEQFRPFQLVAHILKAVHTIHPELPLWTQPPYEYEYKRLPVDVITGSRTLREWVENPHTAHEELAMHIADDIHAWQAAAEPYLLYHEA